MHLAHRHGGAAGLRGAGPLLHIEGTFALLLLNALLVFDLLLDVLVALQDLVVLILANLESLVHLGFQLLLQGLHLLILLHDHVRFTRIHLLLHLLSVLIALLVLERVRLHLDLVGLLVLLLAGGVLLLLPHVE